MCEIQIQVKILHSSPAQTEVPSNDWFLRVGFMNFLLSEPTTLYFLST